MPWVDSLADFRQGLASWDVGLAPLLDTQWNRAKSDVKFLEYSAAGLASIVARTEAYRPVWDQPNPPALVAQTPDEWAEAIRYLVKNRDEVKTLAARAREYVWNNRLIQHEIGNWRRAVTGS